MHMAHILAKQEVPFGIRPRTWSENVKYAWYFEQFRAWLNSGIVTFSFWKKDGSIREAKGTTNPVLVPEDKRPKNTTPPSGGWGAIPYFDLDKNEWRSFSVLNFISLDRVWRFNDTLA